jgi:hypothetical protein
MKIMKKNFVLIAALVAALAVAFVSCGDDGVVSGTGEKTPAVQYFDTVTTGIVKDDTKIIARGSATFDKVEGVLNFSSVNPANEYGDGAGFTIIATGATADSTITVKYVCKVLNGTAKVTLKNGANGDGTWLGGDVGADASPGGQYQGLKNNEEATFVLNGKGFSDPTKIGFQRGDDRAAFFIKILDIKVEG